MDTAKIIGQVSSNSAFVVIDDIHLLEVFDLSSHIISIVTTARLKKERRDLSIILTQFGK